MEQLGKQLQKIEQCLQDNTIDKDAPIDDFQYNCELCKDTSTCWVEEKTGPQPCDFKMLPVPCPKCGERRRKELLWDQSGISESDMVKTFSTFDLKTAVQKAAYGAIQDIIADVSQVDLVLLYGPSGTGKSHLGFGAVIHWIENGKIAKVVRCGEWLDEMKSAFRKEGNYAVEDLKMQMFSTHYLVIDELSCATDFEWRTMDEIISRRYDRHYPTIVITNKDLPELEDFFPRILSRSNDKLRGRRVVLDGIDYRTK